MLAVLGKEVSLRTPARLLTTCDGVLGKEQIQVRQVFNVDVTPDGRSFCKLEAPPTGKDLMGNVRDLVAAGISGAGSFTINSRWTNNRNLQRGAVAADNNLVDVTVKVVSLSERGDFGNVLDVIEDLGVKLAEFIGLCKINEDSRAGSVYEV